MSAAPSANARPVIAVVGNPNAGKTTLFNALTGGHQKVGNYPGVTVERVSGSFSFDGLDIECLDIPGLYSLRPVSEDERVAAEVITGPSRPDAIVCVLDASNLERNLYLFAQLAEPQIPTVVALTMVDRLKSAGSELDVAELSELLGVEVVPLVGHKGLGLDQLKKAIVRVLQQPRLPKRDLGLPMTLREVLASLRERMARVGIDAEPSQLMNELAEPGREFGGFALEAPDLFSSFEEARATLRSEGLLRANADVNARYAWAAEVHQTVIKQTSEPKRQVSLSDRIDAVLMHRVFGLLVFVGAMYLVFQSIYTFSNVPMDLIKGAFDSLSQFARPHLSFNPILQSFVCDGMINGVGAMLVFLPQIAILFFFIAVLEGTGYLARAAFLMDRLLGWCGLNGRAFIPLLSSFACAIPGIMAARVMPDSRSRLATILVAPLMSCSARLPVYLMLIGAFIEPRFGPFWAGFTLFAMHFLGLLVAIPVVWFLNRKIIRGKRLPFMLELPPYQWPKWRDVWLAIYFRCKVFVQVAGTTIVAMSVVIWAMSYFPHSERVQAAERQIYLAQHQGAKPEEADAYVEQSALRQSYLGQIGRAIQPVFEPAGFDWRITTSILAAFPAREAVVPELGIVFSLGHHVESGSNELRNSLRDARREDGSPLLTPFSALGLMVFFALCCQCMSTLATVRRETNSWKWPLFMFTYMTAFAYLGAVAFNQLGHFLTR
jgi:ferrous iron transport protein B